jgi:hypothetical protein
METLIEMEETTKNLRYVQYRIAQKFSADENILSLLPSADIATCLDICLDIHEQMDDSATPHYFYH